MHQRHLAGLATATVLALAASLPLPAAAAEADTLYVDNTKAAGCSDTGPGSASQPLCTVQAAADRVQPGQTVKVAAAKYSEQVTLTRSGTPGKPISFVGGRLRDGVSGMPTVTYRKADSGTFEHGFVLNGVHDVTVSGFAVSGRQESFLLTDTQRVTVDSNYVANGDAQRTAAIRLTGAGSDITVSRNLVKASGTNMVVVDPGVKRVVLTTNAIDNQSGAGGIRITDSPGTVVTSNTVSSVCGPALALLGDSSGATVKNNVLAASYLAERAAAQCDTGQAVKMRVSPPSAEGTVADFNVATASRGAAVYDWAGATYADATTLHRSHPELVGHDINTDPGYQEDANTAVHLGGAAPAIDSADPSAPGQLSTDVLGFHPIDDPHVANTGTSFADRGAMEFTTSSHSFQIASPGSIPTGTEVTFQASHQDIWSPVISIRYDFGDGTSAVAESDSPVQHSYASAGSYELNTLATMANGDTVTAHRTQLVKEPGPLIAGQFATRSWQYPLSYSILLQGTASPWSIRSVTFDFGDGSPVESSVQSAEHIYAQPGDYTVTATVTDAGGRTEKVSQLVHAVYQPTTFHAMAPTRITDTRTGTPLRAGQSITLSTNQTPWFDQSPSAVVLNVTAISKNSDGHLTVYPAGSDRPQTSNLNVVAGRAVPNLVTVPVSANGSVTIFNSSGDVDVVVDRFGYYSASTETGDRFTPTPPRRLVDTRDSRKLDPAEARPVKVAGVGGIPANAASVVLNLTATEADSDTYLAVLPGGQTSPSTSNLNPVPGRDVSNQVIVPIGPDGTVNLYNNNGTTHAILDVFGYYAPDGQGLFTPTTPRRLLDTRETRSPLGTDGTRSLAIGGQGGVPADATAAVLNVTATETTADSFLTVWPHGSGRPNTSNVNFPPNSTVPNHVITPLGTNGTADLYNHVGSTQVVADLFGYFTKG
ncbi:PKD domain-containing protein [Kitasatospora sp. NPDC049258]|uniref:PKD domain-containing protein n=1 Tax=Kitasatospora sp. NPDC049258 TaxID=3155394 RepID=UPI00343512FF